MASPTEITCSTCGSLYVWSPGEYKPNDWTCETCQLKLENAKLRDIIEAWRQKYEAFGEKLEAENAKLKKYVTHLKGVIWGLDNAKDEQSVFIKRLTGKLPRYADTGEPFVPGVDDMWVAWHGKVLLDNGPRWDDSAGVWVAFVSTSVTVFFSTESAALAARDKSMKRSWLRGQ